MKPKEKAIELVNKYLRIYDGRVIQGKQCALIAVDLILDETIYYFNDDDLFVEYWQEVKQEIELL